MKLLDGERLESHEFILKLSMNEVSLCAWALIRYAREVPHRYDEISDLAFQFAGLSGDH